jgi:adenylosuccinate lyase
MLAPDATSTLAFMIERATSLVEGLVVYPEAMKENMALSNELYFSEGVLLAMVRKGRPRQKAYELVQKSAMRAFSGERSEGGSGVLWLLAAPDQACFDLAHALRMFPSSIELSRATEDHHETLALSCMPCCSPPRPRAPIKRRKRRR